MIACVGMGDTVGAVTPFVAFGAGEVSPDDVWDGTCISQAFDCGAAHGYHSHVGKHKALRR